MLGIIPVWLLASVVVWVLALAHVSYIKNVATVDADVKERDLRRTWRAAKILTAVILTGCLVHLTYDQGWYIPAWLVCLATVWAVVARRKGDAVEGAIFGLATAGLGFAALLLLGTITDSSEVLVLHGSGDLTDHPRVVEEPAWCVRPGSTLSSRATAVRTPPPVELAMYNLGVATVTLDPASVIANYGDDYASMQHVVHATMADAWADTRLSCAGASMTPEVCAHFQAGFEGLLRQGLRSSGLTVDEVTWGNLRAG